MRIEDRTAFAEALSSATPHRSAMDARALGLLALAQLAIGAAAIFARFALTASGPLAAGALRLGLAALPVLAFAGLRGRLRPIDRYAERRLVVAGLLLAVHFGTWIASLRFASVAISTLLVCTAPLFTEAWSTLRSRRARPLALAGIAAAALGVAAIAGAPSRSETALGIGLALAGGVAMAGYLIVVRGCDPRYDMIAIVARTYPVAAVALGVAAIAAADPFPPFAAGPAWGGIAAMAFVSQLFGHTALNAAVRTLSATLVATTTLLEPAIAAAGAAAIFGERLAPATLAGALAILAGIALTTRAELVEPPSEEGGRTPSNGV